MLAFGGISLYNKYKEYCIKDLTEKSLVIQSKIESAESFQRLFLLHQGLIKDEVFRRVIPANFYEFKKEYSSLDKMYLLFQALNADEIYDKVISNDFQTALIEYAIQIHSQYRGIISHNQLRKSGNEIGLNELIKEKDILTKKQLKAHSELLTIKEQRKAWSILCFSFIAILFVLRYLIYALKWSIKILKQDSN